MTVLGTTMADALGYIASALVLWTFSLNSMSALRVVAIASNVMFIAYGAAAQLWPVLLLHAILLPLNGWRLWQLRRGPARPVVQAQSTGWGAGAMTGMGGRPSTSSTVQARSSNAASCPGDAHSCSPTGRTGSVRDPAAASPRC